MRPILVRRPRFDFGALPPEARDRWFGGDPFFSQLVNALSLTFPEGERFFVESVRRFRHAPQLAELEEPIKAFMAQELLHGRAHEAFNAYLLEGHPRAAELERRIREELARLRQLAPMEQLAVTCALEHFTAVLAELLLEEEALRALMHPEVLRMLEWHAVEETEHKAVAFDVYRALGGSYFMRARVMLHVTEVFVRGIGELQSELLGSALEPRSLARAAYFALVSPGYVRRIVRGYLDYYRPGFHPWQRDPRAALERATAAVAA